jgi:FtsP/CotA-like multicopper oxidase with cupredoxin domain
MSLNGVLNVSLTMRYLLDTQNFPHYCLDSSGNGLGFVESPTLYLNPGDQLNMDLTNDLPLPSGDAQAAAMTGDMTPTTTAPGSDAGCNGHMSAVATNMHFHGLNVPPVCHQDDVLNTLLQPGDPTFHYNITIPSTDAPGLFWYHPHPHGEATAQVNGGAAGAIVIEGMEKVRPEVAGLTERVLMLRQEFPKTPTWVPGPYSLTLNFQPAITPGAAPPIITMKLGSQEFWRFCNATSQGFLNLQVLYDEVPQNLKIIAIDGVPLTTPMTESTIPVPPAGRVEFIVAAPTAGQTAMFNDIGTATGAVGNFNGFQELATIQTSTKANGNLREMPAAHGVLGPQRFANLINQTVTTSRNLYFSEAASGTNGPTKYYITEAGQVPHTFTMDEPPAIKTTVGAVEDWTIENRAQEDHAFHIHQIHFLVMEMNGQKVTNPYLSDTIILPFWSAYGFPGSGYRWNICVSLPRVTTRRRRNDVQD